LMECLLAAAAPVEDPVEGLQGVRPGKLVSVEWWGGTV
jgi:hypothetical protein